MQAETTARSRINWADDVTLAEAKRQAERERHMRKVAEERLAAVRSAARVLLEAPVDLGGFSDELNALAEALDGEER